jgi:hypothetical protein
MLDCLAYGPHATCVVTRGRVWLIGTLTLAANFMAPACRYPSVALRAGLLTTDRIRGPPGAKELERHADSHRSPMRSTGKRTPSRRSTRRHSGRALDNCRYSQTPSTAQRIATRACPPHPRIKVVVNFIPSRYAAHVLRNHRGRVCQQRSGASLVQMVV